MADGWMSEMTPDEIAVSSLRGDIWGQHSPINHKIAASPPSPSPSIGPEVHRQMVEALRLFADERNWRANGRFDPNSGNFDAIAVANAALSLLQPKKDKPNED